MKNYQASCELCGEGKGEYPQDLTTGGITVRKLICAECKGMVDIGAKGLKEELENYYNGNGAYEDLPLETKEKVEGL